MTKTRQESRAIETEPCLGGKWGKLAICLCLVAATFLAYEPVRHNGFVEYDDQVFIYGNHHVSGGFSLDGIAWALTDGHVDYWHPLTWFSIMLDCQLYGLQPLGHHITSVLIHALASLLLFLVLTRMTAAIWPSAFVAAVFALHPLHVESVAWAAERKDVLASLFSVLTIWAYMWYVARPAVGRYLLVLAAFIMGLMSKPTTVTLPLVLLLLDYWPLGRVAWKRLPPAPDASSAAPGKPAVWAPWLLAEKVPMLVLSAALCVLTFIVQKDVGVVSSLERVPLDFRILNMFHSYARYLYLTLWPHDMVAIYPLLQMDRAQTIVVIVCALLLVAATALCIRMGRTRKYLVVGWLWYLVTLIPVIGLVQSGSQAMADRYMYMPMIGLLIIVAWAAKDLLGGSPLRMRIAAVVVTLLLGASVLITRTQIGYWRDTMTLFSHAIEVTKNNPVAEYSVGCSLNNIGQLDAAAVHLNKAITLSPRFVDARMELGKVLLKQRMFSQAVQCLEQIVEQKSDSAEAYTNLALGYSGLGRRDQAQRYWAKAISLDPDNTNTLNNLAWTLAVAADASPDEIARAVQSSERACLLTGYRQVNYLDTLSVAYAAAGRYPDAIEIARTALDLAREDKQDGVAAEIQSHLDLYRSGKAYHQP